jgi:hypothetical protein
MLPRSKYLDMASIKGQFPALAQVMLTVWHIARISRKNWFEELIVTYN